jgi:diphthamide synthase subunit DPH2
VTSAFGGRVWHLEKLDEIELQVTSVACPRNPLGFSDKIKKPVWLAPASGPVLFFLHPH